jgi:hypothetical protein
VSAAQLTAADAAGTIAGPVATITALPGQSAVSIAFSQTVTSTTAALSTGYSIFGPGTPPTVSSVAYSTTTNKVTLTLSGALQTTDVIRINGGIIATSAGLTVSTTDLTVGYDLVVPVCTVYASTGNDDITITCNELVVQVGTLDNDVDTKVTVGGAAQAGSAATGSGGAALSTASKTVAIDTAANFTATGAAIVIQKDLLKDLAGNKVGALTGTVVTDTTKPTVVGLPTYTLTGLTPAIHDLGHTKASVVFDTEVTVTAVRKGEAGNFITLRTVDGAQAPACTVGGAGTAASPYALTVTWDLDGAGANDSTDAILVTTLNASAACNVHVTAALTGTSANVAAAVNAVPLAGGKNSALILTSVATGVGANGYEIVITDSGTTGCVVTYAAATKTVSVAHDVGASDFCTPSAMKAAIEAHASTKGLFNIALGDNSRDVVAQDGTTAALGAFTGGTTRLTVSTTFSEAVTVSASHVMYDMNGDDSNEVNSASTTCVGSACTSLWTLDGTTYQVVPAANSSEIQYTTGIVDLALNAMVSVQPLLSAP